MNKMKQAFLAGMVLAALGGGDASAHDSGKDCFAYSHGNGSVEICTGRDHHDHDERFKTGRPDAGSHSGHPVFYYGPPGHQKKRWHRKHQYSSRYVFEDGHWWLF